MNLRWPVAVLVLVCGAPAIGAQKQVPVSKDQTPPAPKKTKRFPDVGAPVGTRPAGRRGLPCDATADDTVFQLGVLGPREPKDYRVSSSRPRIFWFVSKPLARRCQAWFTLACDPADQVNGVTCPGEPVEINLAEVENAGAGQGSFRPGVQSVDLSSLVFRGRPVSLQPNIVYRWYISVRSEAGARSKDVVDGAFIGLAGKDDREPWYDRLAAAMKLPGTDLGAALKNVLPRDLEYVLMYLNRDRAPDSRP